MFLSRRPSPNSNSGIEHMPRVFAVVSLVGIMSAGVSELLAVGQTPPSTHALVDEYCITCHSDRLMTGGLTLEQLDVDDVHANVEILEKVVRKLRDGLMPPEGRPRPRRDGSRALRRVSRDGTRRRRGAQSWMGVFSASEPHRIRQRNLRPARAGGRRRRSAS